MSKLLDFVIHERLVVSIALIAVLFFGWRAIHEVPLDAIPNVAENQVILLSTWPGRSPKDIEDQVTYPLSVALQAVPGAKSVRGKSMFGFSFVQVTFEDGVDFYWARSRVAEQLGTVADDLPDEVTPQLAPDATPLGQIYYYVLQPPAGMDLAELRSRQDFFIKYALQSVPGVAEVASIGGYVKQYQVEVDPDRLRYHDVTLRQLIDAVDASNIDVGAKTVESGGMEFIVRGKGFIGAGKSEPETIEQIENTVITSRDGVPVQLRDVAAVQLGPAFRRGALDFNGSEAVGGVVVMRYGENPREVIDRVKEKIDALEPQLEGIKIQGIYDRTQLINETVTTLTGALTQQIVITIVVVLLFLLHIRASLVVAITLPMAVLMSFIAMRLFSVDANIMSLAGIAIAVGTMVDVSIIVSENVYSHLATWESDGSRGGRTERLKVIREAALEVVPAVITAVTTTVVSFLPVFLLTGRDYRLFAPLAWTKTFALVASLIVAVVLVPLLCRVLLKRGGAMGKGAWSGRGRSSLSGLGVATLAAGTAAGLWGAELAQLLGWSWGMVVGVSALVGFAAGYWISRERIVPIESSPLSRVVRAAYEPTLRWVLAHRPAFFVIPGLICLLGLGGWLGLPRLLQPLERVASRLGADLNAIPGYADAKHLLPGLESDDWIALDEGSWFYMPSLYPAASFNQAMEVLQTQDTMIKQIPEVENVLGKIGRVESALDPAPAAMIETYVMLKPKEAWREGMTERAIWDEINRVATLPGITPASPLQPIEGRVVMLQSGIKASMAVRIYGDTLEGLSKAAGRVADQLKQIPLVDDRSVNPDIVMGKPYFEFDVDREESSRYGMTTMAVNQIIAAGLGGLDVTTTVEGRERFPIQVRFHRDVRGQIDRLGEIPVVTHGGEIVPLDRLADLSTSWGPGMINSEDARLVAHISFSPAGMKGDLETVDGVMAALAAARQRGELSFPDGNFELEAVGSFRNQVEANQRLMWVVPVVILINLLIIYFQFRQLSLSLAVFTGIPVAFGGGMILLAITATEMNTAIWIGFIALFGIAVDDGVVIATYLKQAFQKRQPNSIAAIREATVEAGLRRIRPCLMTTGTTLVALVPVLLATGRGADVARAMALPVFGGMCVELVTLLVVPAVFCATQEVALRAGMGPADEAAAEFPRQAA